MSLFSLMMSLAPEIKMESRDSSPLLSPLHQRIIRRERERERERERAYKE
jgi:hypothetical protein